MSGGVRRDGIRRLDIRPSDDKAPDCHARTAAIPGHSALPGAARRNCTAQNWVYRTLNMIPYRHIAIEGPVGAGKVRAGAQTCRTLSIELCVDPAHANPSAALYQNMNHHALATQLYCLRERAASCARAWRRKLRQRVRSDFLFERTICSPG